MDALSRDELLCILQQVRSIQTLKLRIQVNAKFKMDSFGRYYSTKINVSNTCNNQEISACTIQNPDNFCDEMEKFIDNFHRGQPRFFYSAPPYTMDNNEYRFRIMITEKSRSSAIIFIRQVWQVIDSTAKNCPNSPPLEWIFEE